MRPNCDRWESRAFFVADAKRIVSRDKDLLDLMDAMKPEAADFQGRFPLLRILDPVSFLREIGEAI